MRDTRRRRFREASAASYFERRSGAVVCGDAGGVLYFLPGTGLVNHMRDEAPRAARRGRMACVGCGAPVGHNNLKYTREMCLRCYARTLRGQSVADRDADKDPQPPDVNQPRRHEEDQAGAQRHGG